MELFIGAALSVICILACVIVGRRIETVDENKISDEDIRAKIHANPDFIRAAARANQK
jgi:hypothetical protein